MAALLKVVDEHFGVGEPVRRPACEVRLVSERATPREIIRRRVEAEVDILNQRKLAHLGSHAKTRSFLIDIEASSPEAMLNPALSGKRNVKLFDVNSETRRALEAFEKRSFIMLLDDRQINDLDFTVTLTPDSEAVFLYLTPLKGG